MLWFLILSETLKTTKDSAEFIQHSNFLQIRTFQKTELGRYELDGDNIFYMVQNYDTDPDKTVSEAHKKYIDIQCILSGKELFGVAPISAEKKLIEAKPENDVWFYECETEALTLFAGSFMVLYPNDLHCPGVGIKGVSTNCRKVVVKVKVSD